MELGRIKVKDFGPCLSEIISDGDTIEDVISALGEYSEMGYERFEWTESYEGYEARLYLFREETDREYKKRLKENELRMKREAKQKEARRKKFESLRLEFTDT